MACVLLVHLINAVVIPAGCFRKNLRTKRSSTVTTLVVVRRYDLADQGLIHRKLVCALNGIYYWRTRLQQQRIDHIRIHLSQSSTLAFVN